jgi:hypothetical protein
MTTCVESEGEDWSRGRHLQGNTNTDIQNKKLRDSVDIWFMETLEKQVHD